MKVNNKYITGVEYMNSENINIERLDGMQFRCQNCGSEMVYSPEMNSLFCEACNSTKEIEIGEFKIIENDFKEALEKKGRFNVHIDKESVVNEVECSGCGARSIYNGEVFADKCVYCGSSYVVTVEGGDYIKPEYVIPFKIDKKEADKKIANWAKSQFYMKSDFRKSLRNDGLYGVYISFWTFDVNTTTPYSAKRGVYIEDNAVERNIKWSGVTGTSKVFFDDILVHAVGNKVPNISEQSNSFDTTLALPYNEEFISGFIAMKYEIDLEQAWEIGKEICNERIKVNIKEEIGGDEVRELKISPSMSDVTFKHVILPIWLSGFTYKDQVYTYIVNGQTGRVSGKYPLDTVRVALTIVALVLWLVTIWLMMNL